MGLNHARLSIDAGTTTVHIAEFLEDANERLAPGAEAGVRACHEMRRAATGQKSKVLVLYVRTDKNPKSVADLFLLILDKFRAVFHARREYALAAKTLLEHAVGEHAVIKADSAFATKCNDVLAGNSARLTSAGLSDAWQAVFPQQKPLTIPLLLNQKCDCLESKETRVEPTELQLAFTGLRQDMSARSRLPPAPGKPKNQNFAKGIVERGVMELPYLAAMFNVSRDRLGHDGKAHRTWLLKFLGINSPEAFSSLYRDLKDFVDLVELLWFPKPMPEASVFDQLDREPGRIYLDGALAFCRLWTSRSASQKDNDQRCSYAHMVAIDYLVATMLRNFPDRETSPLDVATLLKSAANGGRAQVLKCLSNSLPQAFCKQVDREAIVPDIFLDE